MDLSAAPPRRWAEDTILISGMQPLALHLDQVLHDFEVEHDGQWGQEPTLSDDERLAVTILMDRPHYFYGQDGLNRYAHGGWALLTLGHNDDAWKLLKSISWVGRLARIPLSTFYVFTFAALRLGRIEDAKWGVCLAHYWHRPNRDERDFWQLLELVKAHNQEAKNPTRPQ